MFSADARAPRLTNMQTKAQTWRGGGGPNVEVYLDVALENEELHELLLPAIERMFGALQSGVHAVCEEVRPRQ